MSRQPPLPMERTSCAQCLLQKLCKHMHLLRKATYLYQQAAAHVQPGTRNAVLVLGLAGGEGGVGWLLPQQCSGGIVLHT